MAVSRTANSNLDSWFALVTGSNMGNGGGRYMGIGAGTGDWSGWQNRMAIRIPRGNLFDGVPSASMITSFQVKLRVAGVCFGAGAGVKFWLERGTTAFAENGEGRDCFVSTDGAANARWPGPTRTTTNRVKYEGAPSGGDWITINMLDLGREWFTGGWTELVLVGIAADTATGYDETNTARRVNIHSRHSASPPYVQLTFNSNSAPNIPRDLTPADGAKLASTPGYQGTITGRHTDPDGDAATKYQVEWYPSTATDATPGTPTISEVYTATTAHNSIRSHTFGWLTQNRLPIRTAGKWRLRFYDGQWGAWSLLRAATTAYLPAPPQQPYVTPGTLTPLFYGSLSSNDSADYITAAEVTVYQDPALGQTITKWASGKVAIAGSPTRFELAYGGSALAYGTKYRYVMRLWNRDDVASEWTSNLYFTQQESLGPTISPNSTATKQNTKTPTFTLSDPGGGNIDQYRMWFYSPTGTLLRDTGAVSQTSALTASVVTPTGLWDWGQEPMVAAAIRITGNANIGPTSEQKTIRINAAPGSPYPLSLKAPAVQRSDAVGSDTGWHVPSQTPTLVFPFRDTDKDLGYTEAPTRREIELLDAVTLVAVTGSPFIITTGITDELTTPTLTWNTVYRARARYDDNANVRGPWSAALFFKPTEAPTLSSVTPLDAAAITDPTPTIAWTFASASGKAQLSYRVTASVGGARIHDTGWVASTANNHTIPAGILPNAATVSWTLDVLDTDELPATQVARTFTTSFTKPPALTGLTLTQDDDAKAMLIEWDASGIPTNEFHKYILRARAGAGQFHTIAEITDQLPPVMTDAFGRSVTGGWGTPDVGPAYVAAAGAAANLSVADGVGRVTHSTAGQVNRQTVDTNIQDARSRGRLRVNQTPVGGNADQYVELRHVDTSNHYRTLFRHDTAGNIDVFVIRVLAGVATTLATLADALTAVAAGWVHYRVEAEGVNPTNLRVRVWAEGTTEPTTWDWEGTDSSAALQVTADIGFLSDTPAGVTSVPMVYEWDDLRASNIAAARPSYLYRGAEYNTEVIVQVTQYNGWAEGDPLEGTGLIEFTTYDWLRPEPIELHYVQGGAYSDSLPTRHEEFRPLGRNTTLVTTWETGGKEIRLRLFVPPEDLDVIDTLRADQVSGFVGILKAPDGTSAYSIVRDVSKTHETASFYNAEVSFVEVGSDAGSF